MTSSRMTSSLGEEAGKGKGPVATRSVATQTEEEEEEECTDLGRMDPDVMNVSAGETNSEDEQEIDCGHRSS